MNGHNHRLFRRLLHSARRVPGRVRVVIAALFVERHGVYSGAPSVFDLWDAGRDARLYAGEHPVIAHPPCERWGRYATRHGAAKGADGGCFESALQSVERWGGSSSIPPGQAHGPRLGWLSPRGTADG